PTFQAEINFKSPFAYWTLGIVSVILTILADAGNLINLFVLTRRHMRSTMTTLLVTLAYADLVPPTVVSINSILFYHCLPKMEISSTFLTSHNISKHLFNSLANIFTTFSNWMIVLITTFRLIVVKKPLLAKNYCNRRTARYAIISIFILSFFVNLPLFLFTSIQLYCTGDGITYYGLQRSSILMTKVFSRLYYPLMVSISLLIPWLICFFIWLFLIRALKIAQKQLQKKNIKTTFSNDRKQDTFFRITLMIVCVLSVYMVCRSAHLVEVIHILFQNYFPASQLYFTIIRVRILCISNIMLTINHGAYF
ncbi:unnamed protein product, partial [Didymodactylos carnosus]